MNAIAILLVVLSAVMHAGRNYLTKTAADKQSFIWWYEMVGLLLFTPLFITFYPASGRFSVMAWTFMGVSGVLHFVYWYYLSKALDVGDLSLVYPIMRSSPALVLLLSVCFLQEQVSLQGASGIILVALGSYAINMQRFGLAEFLRPIQAVAGDRAIKFAFLTLLSVTAYSIVDKMAVEEMHPVLFAYLYPWISMLFYSTYLFGSRPRSRVIGEWRANRGSILICGFLSIFGYFLILLAFTIDRVSYIVGLRQISIVFAVLLGGFALKEPYRQVRIVCAAVIFMGTFLIAFG